MSRYNNLQMVAALITAQAKTITDPEVRRSLSTIMGQVEALSTVHRRLYQSDDVTRFSVAEFVSDIAADVVGASGRKHIDIRFDLDPVTIPADKAAPIALMINELITNALKHAFPPEKGGKLAIIVKRAGTRLRIEIEDDGVGMPTQAPGSTSSFGLNLIRTLARQLRAEVAVAAAGASGTKVTIDMPIEQLAPGA